MEDQGVVYVSTKESLGIAFKLEGYDYLICPERVVRRHSQPRIILADKTVKSEVAYIDESINLALCITKESIAIKAMPFSIVAANIDFKCPHDPLDGQPVFNSGKVVSIAHYQNKSNRYAVYYSAIKDIVSSIDAFKSLGAKKAIKCPACGHIVVIDPYEKQDCANCGNDQAIFLANDTVDKSPIIYKIETIIKKAGYKIELTRRAANKWHLTNSNALVEVSYHDKTGAIILESTLKSDCKGFNQEIEDYLLKQNFYNKALNLSIKNNDVMLSTVKYDQYLDLEKMADALKKFVLSTQRYQQILSTF